MIEVQKNYNGIGFRVSGDLLIQIYEWERSLDEMVFNEQLQTGSFRGVLTIDGGIRKIMEKAQQEGKILPYYGAGGSSGACIYKFQMDGLQCHLQVKHTATQETLDLVQTIESTQTGHNFERKSEIQFSILPYVTDEELSPPWTGERHQELVCKIAQKEYQNLINWSNWNEDLALTPRYCYHFGQVSLGATGFAVKVFDTGTHHLIDVTDYDSW